MLALLHVAAKFSCLLIGKPSVVGISSDGQQERIYASISFGCYSIGWWAAGPRPVPRGRTFVQFRQNLVSNRGVLILHS